MKDIIIRLMAWDTRDGSERLDKIVTEAGAAFGMEIIKDLPAKPVERRNETLRRIQASSSEGVV
jgi:hypothetical protein